MSIAPALKKRSKLSVLMLAGFGLALLALNFTWSSYNLMAQPAAPSMARYLPEWTPLYVEAPDLRATYIQLRDCKVVQKEAIEQLPLLQMMDDGFAESFGLEEEVASALAQSLSSIAVALPEIKDNVQPQPIILVAFRHDEPVKHLLKSERFEFQEKTMGGAEIYQISGGSGADEFGEMLDEVQTDEEHPLAWFPGQKLMAVSSRENLLNVERVVGGSISSLASSEKFRLASERFLTGASLVAYFDPSVLDTAEVPKEALNFAELYIKDRDPITFSFGLSNYGMRSRFSMVMSGDIVPPKGSYGSPHALKLASRLPHDTLLAGAMTNKTELKGEELNKALTEYNERVMKSMQKAFGNEGADLDQVNEVFDMLKEEWGIDPYTMMPDLFGDTVVFGVASDSLMRIMRGVEKQKFKYANAAAIMLFEYGSEEKLNQLFDKVESKIRQMAAEQGEKAEKLLELFNEHEEGWDFGPIPEVPADVRLIYRKVDAGHGMIALGNKTYLDHCVSVARGQALQLGSDPAFVRSRGDTPLSGYLYLDAGRLLNWARIQFYEQFAEAEQDAEFSLHFVKTDGPDRLTMFSGMSYDHIPGRNAMRMEMDSEGLDLVLGVGAAAGIAFMSFADGFDGPGSDAQLDGESLSKFTSMMQVCMEDPANRKTLRAMSEYSKSWECFRALYQKQVLNYDNMCRLAGTTGESGSKEDYESDSEEYPYLWCIFSGPGNAAKMKSLLSSKSDLFSDGVAFTYNQNFMPVDPDVEYPVVWAGSTSADIVTHRTVASMFPDSPLAKMVEEGFVDTSKLYGKAPFQNVKPE